MALTIPRTFGTITSVIPASYWDEDFAYLIDAINGGLSGITVLESANSATLGGYSPSTSASANAIPVADAGGRLDSGFMPISSHPEYISLLSDFVGSSTSFADITGLSLSLISGALYEIEMSMICLSSTNAGADFFVLYSGTASTNKHSVVSSTSMGSSVKGFVFTYDNDPSQPDFLTDGGTGFIRVKGIIKTTTSGTLVARYKKQTSGTLTVYAGSFIKATRIS